ncbi:alpha/beta fold hydrolase [Tessaracoccus caeni]|uniref:alpha/beta fold hydrolase n=1 Tax=Tessaracoccus caeni TaxID=3031239 RepID=UPI0023DA011A|nr:alpha/beta hydrolase [Tessaracoccus caeni]MDF1489740.1 alpha/beta hydrolase [Tessaracoccus caeni]
MQQLPTPTSTHDIATSYGTVRVYEWSTPDTADEVPVLLLPGRSSGVPMWSVNLPGFVESRRVLAFDALGDAGLSVQSAPMAGFEDQAAWIDDVLAELAPEGAHLVGHSFGGATAATYAPLHPEKVRSLALLDPVLTFAYPPAAMMWWATVASLPGIPESWREHALSKIGGADEDWAEGDDADPVALMIAAGTRHFSAELPTPSPLSVEQAARLTMPVYVGLAGQDSLAGGDDVAQKVAELLPHAQVQTWENATHSLPMQEAEQLQLVLTDFWGAAEG